MDKFKKNLKKHFYSSTAIHILHWKKYRVNECHAMVWKQKTAAIEITLHYNLKFQRSF